MIYGSIVLVCKTFYSLNSQDLPGFFEDNSQHANMDECVTRTHPSLPVTVNILEFRKHAEMYAQKHDEEFQPFVQQLSRMCGSFSSRLECKPSLTIEYPMLSSCCRRKKSLQSPLGKPHDFGQHLRDRWHSKHELSSVLRGTFR